MVSDSFNKSMQLISSKGQKSFVVAASGGVDSMCLLNLLLENDYIFTMLHVNYGLRGKDAEKDQELLEEWSKEKGIILTIYRAKKELRGRIDLGENLQSAARDIRYRELKKEVKKRKADLILTAHHAQDRLEGFFISMIRGESWRSLAGMPKLSDTVARPLHGMLKNELIDYANSNNILWREDLSNQSDSYLRNRIRKTIIPFIEDENPNWLKGFDRIQNGLSDLRSEDDRQFDIWRKGIKNDSGVFRIPKNDIIKNLDHLKRWLLVKTGSSASGNIDPPMEGNGQFYKLGEYELRVERECLELSSKQKEETFQEVVDVSNSGNYAWAGQLFEVEKLGSQDLKESKSSYLAILDVDLCPFPWKLRNWRKGDRFRPIGMKGSKLLSDFYIDKKFSHRQKQSTPLLIIGDQIAWIAGHRVDARFASKPSSKEVFVVRKLEHKENE